MWGSPWWGWGVTWQGTEITALPFLPFACPSNPYHRGGGRDPGQEGNRLWVFLGFGSAFLLAVS